MQMNPAESFQHSQMPPSFVGMQSTNMNSDTGTTSNSKGRMDKATSTEDIGITLVPSPLYQYPGSLVLDA